jgi:AcrR family transcriptional regulator
MPVRVFTVQEREELRIKMLDAGYALIKEHGMTHASVEKITQAAGLGKSTFYNFFSGKEQFVLELIAYQRDCMRSYFDELLAGREKITVAEAKAYFKRVIFSTDSLYQYLTAADEEKLMAYSRKEGTAKEWEDKATQTMTALLSHMEHVRKDVDLKTAVNLIRIMAFARMHRDELYAEAMEKTLESIYTLFFGIVFEENTF